jgi:hypothetical protein
MADNPRTVKCPKCSAPKHTACRRVRPGRKTEVQFLNDFPCRAEDCGAERARFWN